MLISFLEILNQLKMNLLLLLDALQSTHHALQQSINIAEAGEMMQMRLSLLFL